MNAREAMTSALGHSLWQLALAAAFLALVRVFAGPHRARLRYGAACGALAFQLLAPIVTYFSLRAPVGSFTFVSTPPPPSPFAAWSSWIPVLWTIGVQLMLLRVAFGLWRIRRIEVEASPIDAVWRARFEQVARKLDVERPIRWLASNAVSVPMTAGALRPIVLVPIWALSGIPPAALEMIVAHELAHVRRWDYAVNLVQSLVESLYFFHPAVWWVSAKAREDREACCDDAVIRAFADPLEYARALTVLETSRANIGGLVLASNGGSLMQRIQRLFEHDTEKSAARYGRWPKHYMRSVSVRTVMRVAALGPVDRS